DETDAVLDLSHTNKYVDYLFRNNFKGSRFIIVSLKEGLLSVLDANVSRTWLRDG
ncbi:hypothetical protein DFH29DRAFT_794854, partial [Suillus ampliporus]